MFRLLVWSLGFRAWVVLSGTVFRISVRVYQGHTGSSQVVKYCSMRVLRAGALYESMQVPTWVSTELVQPLRMPCVQTSGFRIEV